MGNSLCVRNVDFNIASSITRFISLSVTSDATNKTLSRKSFLQNKNACNTRMSVLTEIEAIQLLNKGKPIPIHAPDLIIQSDASK